MAIADKVQVISELCEDIKDALADHGVEIESKTLMSIKRATENMDTPIDLSADTVTAGSMLSGVTAHNSDGNVITGTIESMAAQTVTPSASAQTVSSSGKYMTGNVTVNAVSKSTAISVIGMGSDTVTAKSMLSGVTAHNSDGDAVSGSLFPIGTELILPYELEIFDDESNKRINYDTVLGGTWSMSSGFQIGTSNSTSIPMTLNRKQYTWRYSGSRTSGTYGYVRRLAIYTRTA